MSDPVEEAMERSAAAALILERHKGALFPHIAMLHEAFGPDLLRNIVSGAVEAVIIAAQKNGGHAPLVGDDVLLDHCLDHDRSSATIIAFPDERTDG